MTRKERVCAALNHQPVDRLPTDYWGVPEITEKLMRHLGAKDDIEFADKLGIDKIMTVEPKLIANRQNMWDITFKQIPLPDGSGYYDEPESFRLAECETIDDIEECYEFPRTDMYDYAVVAKQCDKYKDFALEGGYTSLTYFYEMLRGTEQMMMDFIANPPLARYILKRIYDFCSEHTKNILEAAQGRIAFAQMTDDLGSQNGLLMSPQMIDSYLRGYYDDMAFLIKTYGAKVFHHDDGAMCEIMPWLIERGVDVLNPLQWHLPGWDLHEMKQKYGKQVCFHGGVDNQYVLPFGGVEEVRGEVRTCIDALFADGTGYILAPCHNIQAITPVENVLELYRVAREHGKR
ncbi:hypothetical protein LJC56_05740 [Christensenellaceae bacterium OttesenSCG-928-K19]|nr:hypothetical protein [Christensenellaceae bacterium OttesenSCG-928-K19]